MSTQKLTVRVAGMKNFNRVQVLVLVAALLTGPTHSFEASSTSSLAVHGVSLHRGAFTQDECDAIIELMKRRPAERDVRESESVSRTNYFDATDARYSDGDGKCPYEWIYERVLEHAQAQPPPGETETCGGFKGAVQWGFDVGKVGVREFSRKLDFVLLHEFEGSDFFDWHTDTKPGDSTGRTVNVNVMLSEPGEDYRGGGLQVGELDVRPRRGDLYFYPASHPHKVEDILGGRRYTLVLAVAAEAEEDRARGDYWARADANFERITTGADGKPSVKPVSGLGGRKRVPSKWHLLFGEHLLALGKEAEADDRFADSYAATDEAHQYAAAFDEDGQRLVAQGQLAASLPFFKLAARIDSHDPKDPIFRQHLESILNALGISW